MAKLQLYINKSLRGYKNLVNINPEDSTSRHIHDYRHALEAIVYDHTRSNVFFLITYLEEGIMLSVLRTVAASDSDDHIAATIFVPDAMPVSADELTSICDCIADALPDDGRDLSAEAVADLRRLFAKDYPMADDSSVRMPSSGRNYAFALYSGQYPSLQHFFRKRFLVPGAHSYAGLLLIENAKGAEGTANLSCVSLPDTAILIPGKPSREGFTPHIAGKPFEKPLLWPAGSELEIQWRRTGFSSVNRIVAPCAGESVTDTPDTSLARKTISSSSFYITEQGTHRSVGSFMIKVNGIDIDEPQSFTYADLHNAKVEISSPGYFAFSGRFDLASSTHALVQMKQLHRTYRFDLPLNTPDPVEAIRIYLKTTKPITQCPIDGYEVTGDGIVEGAGVSNSMVYVGGHSRRIIRYAIAGSLAALLLGFLLGWLTFRSIDKGPHTAPVAVETAAPEPTIPQTPEPVTEPEEEPEIAVPEPTDYTAAVAYLDENKIWARADMETIPGLEGLYDDINNYNFDRILTYWAPLLEGSANFRTVAKAVAGAPGKRDPHTGDHNPTYITAGDEAIRWRSYTYWVDP